MVSSRKGASLLPQHRELIRASSIPLDLARVRGYRSIEKGEVLRRLGFNEQQARLVPGLIIPIHDVFGKNERYQLRPDKPRPHHQSGKPRKYENPPGVGVTLDVHPKARRWVKDTARPLYITEGIRKGDSAVGQGMACIALSGVWNWRGTDESGAVMALADWEAIPLRDRAVYIVFDSDVMQKLSVKQALERLTRYLQRFRARARPIYLPPQADGSKQGLDDWFAAGHTPAELETYVEDWVRGLPTIITTGRQQREVTKDAVEALGAANDPPQVFRYAQSIARIRTDEKGRAFIEGFDASALKGRLTAIADFFRLTAKGDRAATPPPDHIAKDVLALPEWDFPVLEGVVESPTVRAGGAILDTPGYNVATQLVYVPGEDFVLPAIPEEPSERWCSRALKLLLEPLADFPFADDAARANALALFLTPLVRPAIPGPVPVALVDAPQAGTGKSLLAEIGTLLATGRDAEMMSAPRDEEEWRKQITSTLLKGPAVVVIDNVMGRLSSAALARALTATTWKDRILGASIDAVLPQRATWVVTGNNILLGGDLPRRAYWIRLDAATARPWLRPPETFTHPELKAWVRERRPDMIAAALGLVRAWYVGGRPESDAPVLGSYEEWSRIVGGVLAHAGVEQFLGNLAQQYDTLDPEEEQWEAFLTAWYEEFGPKWVHANDIADACWRDGPLRREVLPDDLLAEFGESTKQQGSFVRKLGWALRFREGKRFGADNLRVERRQNAKRKTQQYRVRAG